MFICRCSTISDTKKKRLITLGKKKDMMSGEIFIGQKWKWGAFRSEAVDLKEKGDQEMENGQQDIDVLTLIFGLKSWKGDQECVMYIWREVLTPLLCMMLYVYGSLTLWAWRAAPQRLPALASIQRSQVPYRELQQVCDPAEGGVSQGPTGTQEKGSYRSAPLGLRWKECPAVVQRSQTRKSEGGAWLS